MVRIVPANEANCEDLQTVFGARGAAATCQCQRYKLRPREAFSKFPVAARARRLRQQTHCGRPESETTSGLVAYALGGLAQLALAGGAPAAAERGVRLLAAAEALSPASGAFPGPFRLGTDERAALLAAARVRLDGPAFERLRAEGQAMTLEQAVAYALEDPPTAA